MPTSTYLENRFLDFWLRGQSVVPPAVVYVALHTASPLEEGASEVSGGGYARVALPSALATWSGTQGVGTTEPSDGSGGAVSNNVEITFPAPTADWGAVTHVGIHDAETGGNLLFVGALVAPHDIFADDPPPTFLPDTLAVGFP